MNDTNTVVKIVVCTDDAEKNGENSGVVEYECIGVIVKDEKDLVRIGFTAKNDEVIDYLDIKKSDIVSIETINPTRIKIL